MLEEKAYTIGELADVAGVTPRTIRYYTAEGLLPRPDSRGQYALYSAEHLLRLRLIARLKEAYLPLGEIRARLDQLDAEQLRVLLEEDQGAPEPPTSATDYLSQVLNRPSPRIIAEPAATYGTGQEPPSFQAQISEESRQPRPAAPPAKPYGFAAAVPAPQERLAATARPAEGASLFRKLIPQRRERVPEPAGSLAEAEERWRRVALAPGVELHIREPHALGQRIDRLIALAKDLLREDD